MNRRGELGFTLLEVVIAFVLLAGMLAVVLRLFSEGTGGVARAERRTIALLHAESKLAEVLAVARQPGDFNGVFPDGYRWRASLVARRERVAKDPRPVDALLVTVTVSAPDEDAARGVSLDAIHLVTPPRT